MMLLDLSRSNAAYKWFVEQLYEQAKTSIHARRILENGHPVRTNEADLALETEDVAIKELFLRLSNRERRLVAQLLADERISAVHDVAAFFEDCLSMKELTITVRGQEIPESPYSSMHHDLIGLVLGEGWEDEQ